MEKEIALYIHIPFCKSKCYYCDFPSFSGKEAMMIDYCRALAKEIISVKNRKIKSIFIGGGTPTYLSLEAISILKEAIDSLDIDESIEFTVECNPGTIDSVKLNLFKDMGVNRLSFGLQACQNTLLKGIGRIHSLEDFILSFELARKAGFNNINVDLMFGLPNQTIEQWEESLNKVVELNPEHISCYSLILEEGTVLYERYNNGEILFTGEDTERSMYESAIKILHKSNYNQYEISNFSKLNKECRHNLVYWSMGEYIGCGASSHSFVDGIRFSNLTIIEEYTYKILNSQDIKEKIHVNSEKDNIEEFMFLGLRKTRGISINEFKIKFNKDIYFIYGKNIEKHLKLGLLEVKGDNIMLTPEGLVLSNTVMCEFILDDIDF